LRFDNDAGQEVVRGARVAALHLTDGVDFWELSLDVQPLLCEARNGFHGRFARYLYQVLDNLVARAFLPVQALVNFGSEGLVVDPSDHHFKQVENRGLLSHQEVKLLWRDVSRFL